MDITQLATELRGGKIRECYLIKGAESYLARTARQQILKAIFPSVKPEYDAFLAGQSGMEGVLDSLKTPSMFAPRRVVIVEEVQKLNKADFDAIGEACQNGISTATLILIGEGLKPAQHKNLPKSVAEIECKKLYSNQIPSWLNMEAKRFSATISREAAMLLLEAVGENLGELAQALEKLGLYVGEKKLIDVVDVENLIGVTGQKSIFDFTKALGEKKIGRASELLHHILGQGEPPVKVLTMVARHFRLLAKAQGLLRRKVSKTEFAAGLKVNPFFAGDYAAQARKLNPIRWRALFQEIYQTDAALKSSKHKATTILEKLAWDLTRD